MTAIEDIVTALQTVSSELGNAGSAATTAGQEADQAISQASALGTTQIVAELTGVKDTIEKLVMQILGATEVTGEAIALALAVADST
jgi:hypothetical protein